MNDIVGIDLGTSTSEVAVFKEGRVVVIPNHLGELITPSCVHIGKEGNIIVGKEAKELLLIEPERTFYEVKRMFGTEQILISYDNSFSPEQIQSYIIAYLARCASKFLGYGVETAVITVPAYFTDAQRKQTVRAGELAGLTVARIINEPTSAALDYGLANLSDCKQLLVYDFGGGTLDVTVLELFEGVLDVKSTCGNNKLGGKDFDEAVSAFLTAKFKPDINSVMRIKTESEACKIALSAGDTYHVALPFLSSGKGAAFSIDQTITRKDFEKLIIEMVRSTETQIDTALDDARLSRADVDEVLLVGGSTKIPMVSEFLTKIFDKPPKQLVDPDLAVVRGAAVQAAIISGALSGEIAISDICPFTLGTAIYETVLDRHVYHPLIKKNTAIPVSKTDRFHTVSDYQTQVDIKVYEGEYTNPDNNQLLGNMELDGIPPARAGEEPISCTFAYDVNGILHVSAKVVSTNKEVDVKISMTGVEEIKKVNVDGWQSKPEARKYRPAIRKAEKLINSRSLFSDELEILISQLKEAVVLEKNCLPIYNELLSILEAVK